MKLEALLDVIDATINLPVTSDQKILLLNELVNNIKNNDKLMGR